VSSLQDNVYAFLLFLIATVVAIVASLHGHDKDLFTFAGTVAMTGAAVFHGKTDPPSPA
jgi:hypothetical protein